MKPDGFRAQQDKIFLETLGDHVVPFPQNIPLCNAFNATPYVISMERFAASFGGTDRRDKLIGTLRNLISSVDDAGAKLVALLVGGSILVKRNALPKDIDCVFFYSAARDADLVPTRLHQLWGEAREASVDVRFVPYDADPLVVLKACSFFSVLYGRTRRSAELSRGSVIVFADLKAEEIQ